MPWNSNGTSFFHPLHNILTNWFHCEKAIINDMWAHRWRFIFIYIFRFVCHGLCHYHISFYYFVAGAKSTTWTNKIMCCVCLNKRVNRRLKPSPLKKQKTALTNKPRWSKPKNPFIFCQCSFSLSDTPFFIYLFGMVNTTESCSV